MLSLQSQRSVRLPATVSGGPASDNGKKGTGRNILVVLCCILGCLKPPTDRQIAMSDNSQARPGVRVPNCDGEVD